LDTSFLFWMPPSFFGCLRSSRSCFLSNRTLCLRRTRRCPRRRLANLRLRPTCIPLASSSLALDASFALGRPCASILFWMPPSIFGCLRPWILTLLHLLPYLDASPPSRSLTMLRTCVRTFSHVLFAHRITFHIG
jgi:hypothetical protein